MSGSRLKGRDPELMNLKAFAAGAYNLLLDPLPPIEQAEQNKPLTNERLAIQWAKAKGYPVPEPPGSALEWAAAYGAGIALCGFPVLIVAVIHARRRDNRQKLINELVMRWVDAGKPIN